MEITDVKVIPVDDEKLKAFVSIVFDHCFVVTDIKVIHGPKGLFVSMPSKKRKDGTFKDIAHPLNNQMRQYLEEKVLGVYRKQVSTDSTPASSSATETPEAPAAEAASTSAEPAAAPVDAAAPAAATPESSQAEAPDAPQADSEATGKEGSEG